MVSWSASTKQPTRHRIDIPHDNRIFSGEDLSKHAAQRLPLYGMPLPNYVPLCTVCIHEMCIVTHYVGIEMQIVALANDGIHYL